MVYIKKSLKERLEKLYKARLRYELIKADVYRECLPFEGQRVDLPNGVVASICGRDVGFKWSKEVKLKLRQEFKSWSDDSTIKKDKIIYVQFSPSRNESIEEEDNEPESI